MRARWTPIAVAVILVASCLTLLRSARVVYAQCGPNLDQPCDNDKNKKPTATDVPQPSPTTASQLPANPVPANPNPNPNPNPIPSAPAPGGSSNNPGSNPDATFGSFFSWPGLGSFFNLGGLLLVLVSLLIGGLGGYRLGGLQAREAALKAREAALAAREAALGGGGFTGEGLKSDFTVKLRDGEAGNPDMTLKQRGGGSDPAAAQADYFHKAGDVSAQADYYRKGGASSSSVGKGTPGGGDGPGPDEGAGTL